MNLTRTGCRGQCLGGYTSLAHSSFRALLTSKELSRKTKGTAFRASEHRLDHQATSVKDSVCSPCRSWFPLRKLKLHGEQNCANAGRLKPTSGVRPWARGKLLRAALNEQELPPLSQGRQGTADPAPGAWSCRALLSNRSKPFPSM